MNFLVPILIFKVVKNIPEVIYLKSFLKNTKQWVNIIVKVTSVVFLTCTLPKVTSLNWSVVYKKVSCTKSTLLLIIITIIITYFRSKLQL